MAKLEKASSTTYMLDPPWNGGGFDHAAAQSYWERMPESLRKLASDEVAAGNRISQILLNGDRGIVVVVLERGPLTSSVVIPGIKMHTQHEYGNYCYDDTSCTYEHKPSGCFLSFANPDYVDDEAF